MFFIASQYWIVMLLDSVCYKQCARSEHCPLIRKQQNMLPTRGENYTVLQRTCYAFLNHLVDFEPGVAR